MKINSLVLERKTKSNCMIDLRIVCDRYVDRLVWGGGRAAADSAGPDTPVCVCEVRCLIIRALPLYIWAHHKGSPLLNKGSPLGFSL